MNTILVIAMHHHQQICMIITFRILSHNEDGSWINQKRSGMWARYKLMSYRETYTFSFHNPDFSSLTKKQLNRNLKRVLSKICQWEFLYHSAIHLCLQLDNTKFLWIRVHAQNYLL